MEQYNKYFLYRKQESKDGGITWEDVQPIEEIPSGSPINTYSSYTECIGEEIPCEGKYWTIFDLYGYGAPTAYNYPIWAAGIRRTSSNPPEISYKTILHEQTEGYSHYILAVCGYACSTTPCIKYKSDYPTMDTDYAPYGSHTCYKLKDNGPLIVEYDSIYGGEQGFSQSMMGYGFFSVGSEEVEWQSNFKVIIITLRNCHFKFTIYSSII